MSLDRNGIKSLGIEVMKALDGNGLTPGDIGAVLTYAMFQHIDECRVAGIGNHLAIVEAIKLAAELRLGVAHGVAPDMPLA